MIAFVAFVLYVLFGVISQAMVNRHRFYQRKYKDPLHDDGFEYFIFLWAWPFIAAHHWTTHAVDIFFHKDEK